MWYSMNKTSSILAITLALVIGLTVGSLQTSDAFFHDKNKKTTNEGFIEGSASDQADRPWGVTRYFTSGDPMNECLWDIVASEACQRGILFDNQENMNKKLNWLLEKHGYNFGE